MKLWQPTQTRINQSNLKCFERYLKARLGLVFADYEQLWRWSVDEKAQFWQQFADFSGVCFHSRAKKPYRTGKHFIDGRFFPNATLNYAEHILQNSVVSPNENAIIFCSENGIRQTCTWQQLRQRVFVLADYFLANNIKKGDRVVAYLPNTIDAVVAFLASATIGCVWSSSSPDFGVSSVVERFGQIKAKVLLACCHYHYGGKRIDVSAKVKKISQSLPSLTNKILVDYPGESAQVMADFVLLSDIEKTKQKSPTVSYQSVAFDHPLYILFSSGTTGAPKCITHSSGGALLQHLKEHQLHCDIKAGQRVFFYTTCGWMMWNWLVSALASGATICLYDGSPIHPKVDRLFYYAATEKIHWLGLGAKIIDFYRSQVLKVMDDFDLKHLQTVAATGSPLSSECFDYVYQNIKKDVHLVSMSGGTDIVSCFVLGNACLPVYRGQIQCAGLAMDVDVFDEAGKPTKKSGELVCKTPFPSQPIYFWCDDNNKKYLNSYFARFENIWCHGDFIKRTAQGGFVISGRSDSTLNPGGVRIGTAEIYRYVEQLPQVAESLVVGYPYQHDIKIILFVHLVAPYQLDKTLIDTIKKSLRDNLSPKAVPAKIIAVADIPKTRNGKLAELTVKNAITKMPIDNRDALANPEALTFYENLTLDF